VGNKPLSACLRVLEPTGIYIGSGGGGPDQPSIHFLGSMLHSLVLRPFTTRKMPGLLAKGNTGDLNFLAGLMQSGKVTPVLDRSYALAETAAAVRYVEQLHARGKVVLSVP
jgi:NADPH:quinone reductase-like Zn-dependent oxidoreductase